MSKKRPAPTGFTCTQCNRWNAFTSWVFAHWASPLEAHCDCGAVFDLQFGTATLNPRKKSRPSVPSVGRAL